MRELLIHLIRQGSLVFKNDSIDPIGHKLASFLNDCLDEQLDEFEYYKPESRLIKGIIGMDFTRYIKNPNKELYHINYNSFYCWDTFSHYNELKDFYKTTIIPLKQILPYI